jgi:autotransporter passenger strand-loop-strand repeat protein
VLNGGDEIVSSGGFADATAISGGTLEVASGGTAGAILFGNSGTLQLDALMAFGGTISGFHTPADEIDLRGLAFTSGTTNLSWTQLTSGANGSGTLTVTSGAEIQNLTLLGQYSTANFSATSDGNGGTLIIDPPAPSSATQTPLVAHQ